jgi:hypothetical protein
MDEIVEVEQPRATGAVDVLQIPIPKERLHNIPKGERSLFFMLGYAANKIIMLQKLLIFSANHAPTDPIDIQLSNVQMEMLLRLMIGFLFEGWLLIERRFIGQPIGREYQPLLDDEAQRALADLKRQFGTSKILSTIRNNFSFHFPKEEMIEQAFQEASSDTNFDGEWNVFFGRNKFNSQFMLCDVVLVHAIFKALGESDWAVGQTKIMSEVHNASDSIINFAHAFTAAMWKKYVGPEMLATVKTRIENVRDLQSVALPFFVLVKDDILRTG